MVKKVFCVVAAVSQMLLSVGCQTKQTVETEEKSVTDWGEQVKENQSIPDDEAVAYVNGEPISKERFENYKDGRAYAQASYTDEEVLEKMIRREVLYQEIARCSVTVTEEEVKAFNDERFALMEEDPTSYQIVKDYVDGLGIAMEEYKEISLENSRDSLLTAKYRERLMKEYADRDV